MSNITTYIDHIDEILVETLIFLALLREIMSLRVVCIRRNLWYLRGD